MGSGEVVASERNFRASFDACRKNALSGLTRASGYAGVLTVEAENAVRLLPVGRKLVRCPLPRRIGNRLTTACFPI